MRKRLLSAAIAVILICSLLVIPTSAATYNMYDNATSYSPYQIEPGKELGWHFKTTKAFYSVSVVAPSWGNNIGNMRLSLFKWNKDYPATIAGTPVATKLFENFTDGSTLTMSFPVASAGEYVLLIHDTSEIVGVWLYNEPARNTELVIAGFKTDGGIKGSVEFSSTASGDPFASSMSDLLDLSTPVTPPEETTLPADSPVKQMNVKPDTWTMTDGLGRTISGYDDVGGKREDKFVGMFYWTWHYSFAYTSKALNITEIIRKTPAARNDFTNAAWDKNLANPYFWDAPLLGYYVETDAYVIRKHAEMLADAGVDVIIFDCTNATSVWKPGYDTIFKVFEQARSEGVNVPKIAFMMNFNNQPTSLENTVTELRSVYLDIYRSGKYQDLWFYWEGKPLMVAHPQNLDASDPIENEILNFFTYRENEPTYNAADTTIDKNAWGWCSVYPQTKYGIRKDGSVEQMTVSVAQNWNEYGLVAMNDYRGGVFGRSHTVGDYSYSYENGGKTITVDSDTENSMYYGLNIQQQWDYVMDVDPDFVFITGWNEWIAGRNETWMASPNAFPDEFDSEYSRDIEPTSGELKDYYYTQLIENIRRYKGVSQPDTTDADAIIDITSSREQWKNIYPQYTHYVGSTMKRDSDGWVGLHYTEDTMRNDIVLSKVAFDGEYVYFMAETVDDITPYTDSQWMMLFLDTDYSGVSKNWEGFEYVINRTNPTSTKATLEKSAGGWNFTTVGQVDYTVSGNRLQIKVPRSYLGFGADGNIPAFSFKWIDNAVSDGDILDVYTRGDTAPGSRYAFAFDATGCTYDPQVAVEPIIFEIDVNDGKVSINGLIEGCTETDIVIPAEIDGCPVTSIGANAFKSNKTLESVVLPDSITSIGNSAFYGCKALTSVNIPSNVSTIGVSAFYRCSALEEIVFPDTITIIPSNAFAYCSSLTSIVIPEGVTQIKSYAFSSCSGIECITLPSTLETIQDYAFADCESLDMIINKSKLEIEAGDEENYGYIAAYATQVINHSSCTFDNQIVADKYLKNGATCTSAAEYYYSCECGEKGTTTFTYGEPLGHAYGEWTSDGRDTHSHICSRCNNKETKSHEWGDGVVTTEATYEHSGLMTYTCPVCGANKTEIIPQLEKVLDSRIIISSENFVVSDISSDTVTVTLSLAEMPDFSTFGVSDITFDTSVLELVSFEHLKDGMIKAWDGVRAVFTNEEDGDLNGDIAQITFRIKDGAKDFDGEYDISCSFVAKKADDSDIVCRAVDGVITVSSASQQVITGDVDGSGSVDSLDAIYLLYHTFYSEAYPINQESDFDKDGSVTSADAIYLLYYTFYPTEYPLE